MKFRRLLIVVSMLSIVSACSMGNSESISGISDTATVTGSVTYRERMALTPNAVVEIELLDVSLADTTAIVIAEQGIRPKHQVPISFELNYDPAIIDDRMSYAVRAIIRDGEQLLYTTDRSYPVLTRGHANHVDMVLVRASN